VGGKNSQKDCKNNLSTDRLAQFIYQLSKVKTP